MLNNKPKAAISMCIQFNHLRFSGYFDMFFLNNLYVILYIFILSFGWPLSIVVSSTVFCVFCGASKYHRARFRVWCTFKPWKKKHNFKLCTLMHQNLLYDYYILRLYVSSKLFQGFHSITHLCFCVMLTRVCASVHSFNRTPISGLFVNEWKHHFHSLCIVINSFLI